MQATQPFVKATSTPKEEKKVRRKSLSQSNGTRSMNLSTFTGRQTFNSTSSQIRNSGNISFVRSPFSGQIKIQNSFQDSSTTNEVTLPSLKLRATKNQSVSYSPKPADVNVSTGDENENVSEKTNGLVKVS